MKNLLILSSFFFLGIFLTSCQKVNVDGALSQEAFENTQIKIMTSAYSQSFLNDYIIKDPLRVRGEKPSYLVFKYKDLAYMNEEAFLGRYPIFKQELTSLEIEGNLLREADGIQSMGTRILRLKFLNENNNSSISETKFLLDILIKSQAIDLDVLVDAYLKVESTLNNEEKEKFYLYIQNLYLSEKKYISENWEDLRNKYQSADNPNRKNHFLMSGKSLERRSQAVQYSLEKLPSLNNS